MLLQEQRWKMFALLSLSLLFLNFDLVTPVPVGAEPGTTHFDDRYPVMVPVSSTVIPLLHLFGKPKQGGTSKPRSVAASTYVSPARRMRLLERSRRPEEPVRLITKNSRQKDLNNETH